MAGFGWRLTDGGWPMPSRSHSLAGALRGFERIGGRQSVFRLKDSPRGGGGGRWVGGATAGCKARGSVHTSIWPLSGGSEEQETDKTTQFKAGRQPRRELTSSPGYS